MFVFTCQNRNWLISLSWYVFNSFYVVRLLCGSFTLYISFKYKMWSTLSENKDIDNTLCYIVVSPIVILSHIYKEENRLVVNWLFVLHAPWNVSNQPTTHDDVSIRIKYKQDTDWVFQSHPSVTEVISADQYQTSIVGMFDTHAEYVVYLEVYEAHNAKPSFNTSRLSSEAHTKDNGGKYLSLWHYPQHCLLHVSQPCMISYCNGSTFAT